VNSQFLGFPIIAHLFLQFSTLFAVLFEILYSSFHNHLIVLEIRDSDWTNSGDAGNGYIDHQCLVGTTFFWNAI
jgi:hypothetical protein